MKKGLIALLCASVAAAIMVAIPAKHISNEAAVRAEPTAPTIEVDLKPGPLVTDPEELKKLAEQYDLPLVDEDGQTVSIQVYDFVYPSEAESAPASDHATDSESK